MRTLSFDAIRLVLQNSSSKVSRTSHRRPVVGEDYSALRRPRTAHHVNAWDRAPNPSRTRFHLPCAAKAFFITPSLRRYLGWDGFLHPQIGRASCRERV